MKSKDLFPSTSSVCFVPACQEYFACISSDHIHRPCSFGSRCTLSNLIQPGPQSNCVFHPTAFTCNPSLKAVAYLEEAKSWLVTGLGLMTPVSENFTTFCLCKCFNSHTKYLLKCLFKPRVAAVICSLTKAKVTLVFNFLNLFLVFFNSEIRANHEFSQQPSLQEMFETDKGEFVAFHNPLYVELTKSESLLALVFVHSWIHILHWQDCCALVPLWPWLLLNLSGEGLLLKMFWTYFSLNISVPCGVSEGECMTVMIMVEQGWANPVLLPYR